MAQNSGVFHEIDKSGDPVTLPLRLRMSCFSKRVLRRRHSCSQNYCRFGVQALLEKLEGALLIASKLALHAGIVKGLADLA